MGFFGNLFRTGAVAGTTAAAIKVGEKVKENNPEGIKDVNGDGVINAEDYMIEIKKAAKAVYSEASETVKVKAPEVKAKAKDLKDNAPEYAAIAQAKAQELIKNIPALKDVDVKKIVQDILDELK